MYPEYPNLVGRFDFQFDKTADGKQDCALVSGRSARFNPEPPLEDWYARGGGCEAWS